MGFSLQDRGAPRVDEQTCAGCGQCVRTCPDEVLSLENGKPRAGRGTFLGCIACGHCMAVCPTQSIGVSGRGMRPDDRMELPAAQRRATAAQLEALAVARRSVRRFKPQEVPRALLDEIVRVASTAPMGIPPHEVGVVVFDTRSKVQAFAEQCCTSFARMARLFNPVVLAMMRPLVGKFQWSSCALRTM
jgi:ferredoxin